MGAKVYNRYIAGGRLGSGIAAGSIALFCGSSLHSGHVGSAAGSSKWVYALSRSVCPARRLFQYLCEAFDDYFRSEAAKSRLQGLRYIKEKL